MLAVWLIAIYHADGHPSGAVGYLADCLGGRRAGRCPNADLTCLIGCYATFVGSLFNGELADAWQLDHWRAGQTLAKVTWIDGQDAEHLRIVVNGHEARDPLNLIARTWCTSDHLVFGMMYRLAISRIGFLLLEEISKLIEVGGCLEYGL
jgi:hypothetical protein